MHFDEFVKKLSPHINFNDYDIRFKKSPYYKNENEMWLYRKDDKQLSLEDSLYNKKVIIGYLFNGKEYKTKKSMIKDFKSGRNEYERIYGYKKFRKGILITEEILSDENYLKDYLTYA